MKHFQTIQKWIDFNKKTQLQLKDTSNKYVQQQPVDAKRKEY